MKILIIEDEIKIAEAIESRLVKENYIIDKETDGLKGYYKACDNIYDLIILDIMLPNMNGFEILKKLKEENISSKIIMLTAKSSIGDKLDCFDIGADDYITKPFHLEELVRRVNKELKVSNKNDTITFGDITLNISSSTITLTNNEITNTDSEGNFLRIQKDSWGTSGKNGGDVTLILNNQNAEGNIVVDSISSLKMTMKDSSYFEGSINTDNESETITLTLRFSLFIS